MPDDFIDPQLVQKLIYTFLCSFPYMILILCSFRGRWRFNKKVTFLIVFLLLTVQLTLVAVKLLTRNTYDTIWNLSASIIYIGFIFVAIKEHIGKLIFTVLALTNLGDFNITCAKCIEGIFFHDQALEGYNYTYLLMILLVISIILPVIYMLIFKGISSPVSDSSSEIFNEEGKRIKHPWRYLWLIPAVFYVFWMHQSYWDGRGYLEKKLDPMNTVYLLVIDAGSILIYRTIIKTADLYEKNLSLLAENNAISIQRLCYENLNSRLENMRRTRHDLRHHTALLKEIRKSGDLSALDGLIDMYAEQNYLDQPLVFCENETVNIVIAYYSEIAYKNNISFSVKADIPEDIFIDKKELAVLFGNTLENACDACKEVEGDRFVDLAAAFKTTASGKHYLSILLKNSFATETSIGDNGVFRSTKHEGDGIGISSVQTITKRYGGACSFTPEGKIFTVSVILYE